MHPFGPPAVPGHFFMIVMTKTTNGVAVANFDSCEGCSTHMQLQTEIHKDRCTEFDLVGLIQVFFAINKDFRFPEKSDAECKTVFGKFTIYKPSPTYHQPVNSNACWLFSMAVAEQVIAQLPNLAASPSNSTAYAFFDNIIISVANILRVSGILNAWMQNLRSEHWDQHKTSNLSETIQNNKKVLSNLDSKLAEDVFVGHPWQVQEIGTLRDFYKPNFAYDASNFYISPDLQIITDRSYMLMHMGHRQDSKGWVPRKMQCQQASWIMT